MATGDRRNNTPLHVAAQNGFLEVAIVLLVNNTNFFFKKISLFIFLCQNRTPARMPMSRTRTRRPRCIWRQKMEETGEKIISLQKYNKK